MMDPIRLWQCLAVVVYITHMHFMHQVPLYRPNSHAYTRRRYPIGSAFTPVPQFFVRVPRFFPLFVLA